MPAGTQASAYQRVRDEAQKALRQLKTEIGDRDSELAALREQERVLSTFLGAQPDGRAPAPKIGPRRRVDWRAVLSKLPKQFTAGDVRKVRGLANKRQSEIFAGITRWIDAKLVKRKDRGLYGKIE